MLEEGPDGERIEVGRGRGRKVLDLAIVAVLASGWLTLASLDRRTFTCAVCRANRVDASCLGLTRTDVEETDCSRWYAGQVEPIHAHAWSAGSHCRRFGIPGIYGGYGCSIGPPINGLAATRQVEIYGHFADPLAAKALFLHLGGRDGRPYHTFTQLMRWMGEGYPGTWEDWWGRHRDDED